MLLTPHVSEQIVADMISKECIISIGFVLRGHRVNRFPPQLLLIWNEPSNNGRVRYSSYILISRPVSASYGIVRGGMLFNPLAVAA